MKNYKIPASITFAQGILESGAGKGELCKQANNHFGIKCHAGWTGAAFIMMMMQRKNVLENIIILQNLIEIILCF